MVRVRPQNTGLAAHFLERLWIPFFLVLTHNAKKLLACRKLEFCEKWRYGVK
jgi:hypothetical protein